MWPAQYILVVVFSWVLFLPVFGQKKNANGAIVNESKKREAEYYFTEGEKYFILEDFAKAAALFQKASELNPDNATIYYKLSETQLKNDELDMALKNALRAIELEKSNKYFYLLVIDIYTKKEDLASGSRYYEQMIDNVPGAKPYLMELAALYLYQKKYKEALRAYDKLGAFNKYNGQIGIHKYRIYLQLGDEDAALNELNKLTNDFPEEESYLMTLAGFLAERNKEEEALELLLDFINDHKQGSRASLLVGDIYVKKADYQSAKEYLTYAFENVELDFNLKFQLLLDYKNKLPNDEIFGLIVGLCKTLISIHHAEANAYAFYGDVLRESGDSKGASIQYKKTLHYDPSNFSAWQNVLLIETQLNQYDSVIIHAENALELFPNQSILYYLLGFSHIRNKNWAEAAGALETGKRMSSSDLKLISDFNALLGEAYNGLKQFAKSDRAYDAVLDHDPNNYGVLNNYSYYLALRNERLEIAEKMSDKLINDNPDNATFLDTRAWVLFKSSKYKEAKKVIERAIGLGKVSAIHYEHYGDILYKLGEIEEAVKQWQRAKGMDSNSEIIDKKIADRILYEN